MPANLHRDASFIVRVWWERPAGLDAFWRGQAVHAKTGQACYFERVEDMVTFMERWTGPLWQQEEGRMSLPEDAADDQDRADQSERHQGERPAPDLWD